MYGYKIINGKAVIDEQEAGIIISIFNGYISGLSMIAADQKICCHISTLLIIDQNTIAGNRIKVGIQKDNRKPQGKKPETDLFPQFRPDQYDPAAV